MAHALLLAAGEDVVQFGGAVREDVNALVEVAVAGGLGDAGISGQAVHAAAFAEPAQDEYGLAERAQRPAAARGSDAAAVSGQQTGQVLHDVAGDVEPGVVGDQRASLSGEAADCVSAARRPGPWARRQGLAQGLSR